MPVSQPLIEVIRGNLVESAHHGAIAVVNSNANLLHAHGDPHTVAFLRSSAKPFQALPFVEAGGTEHFDLTTAELALACASHETSDLHLQTVQGMQTKIGIREDRLQCGPHLPGDAAKFKQVIREGITLTPNFNNCSGKHTAMLAFAKMRGLPLENYLDFDHPIQRDILKTLSELCDIETKDIVPGVDGCSAPNFAMPLFNAALGMARLCDPRDLPEVRAAACKKITDAMTSHPEMVSNFGEFDCELMRVGEGKIVTKRGAEGFQIVGILPGVIGDRGVGIAFKVTDGDAGRMNDALHWSPRVRPAVTLEILKQLGALNEAQLGTLAKFGPEKVLKNYAGIGTGRSKPVFELKTP
jgi:L-asparaginase II